MQYTPTNTTPLTLFAANYDCNAYGAGSYNNAECATTSTGDGGSPAENPSGGLADTGYNIIIPVALGLALIIAGAILLVKKLLRKKRAQN